MLTSLGLTLSLWVLTVAFNLHTDFELLGHQGCFGYVSAYILLTISLFWFITFAFVHCVILCEPFRVLEVHWNKWETGKNTVTVLRKRKKLITVFSSCCRNSPHIKYVHFLLRVDIYHVLFLMAKLYQTLKYKSRFEEQF